MEEQGEADHHAVLLCKDHFSRLLHEQRVIDSGFIGHHLVGAFLVCGQFLDKVEDQARLIGLRRADIETVFHYYESFSRTAKVGFFSEQ